jgi:hypothetical protein
LQTLLLLMGQLLSGLRIKHPCHRPRGLPEDAACQWTLLIALSGTFLVLIVQWLNQRCYHDMRNHNNKLRTTAVYDTFAGQAELV